MEDIKKGSERQRDQKQEKNMKNIKIKETKHIQPPVKNQRYIVFSALNCLCKDVCAHAHTHDVCTNFFSSIIYLLTFENSD